MLDTGLGLMDWFCLVSNWCIITCNNYGSASRWGCGEAGDGERRALPGHPHIKRTTSKPAMNAISEFFQNFLFDLLGGLWRNRRNTKSHGRSSPTLSRAAAATLLPACNHIPL